MQHKEPPAQRERSKLMRGDVERALELNESGLPNDLANRERAKEMSAFAEKEILKFRRSWLCQRAEHDCVPVQWYTEVQDARKTLGQLTFSIHPDYRGKYWFWVGYTSTPGGQVDLAGSWLQRFDLLAPFDLTWRCAVSTASSLSVY